MPYIPRQYDSSRPFIQNYNNLGNITDVMDAMRINCYNLFDDFYYNRPQFFKVTMRGNHDIEIYLPSTKMIVNSVARYLAVDFNYTVKGGSADSVKKLIDGIWEREEINKKHIKGKRSYLTRGDMCWYITADSKKGPGERISINTIHPSCVFPIEDPENATRVIGYHIVDVIRDPRDPAKDSTKMIARRQTYIKEPQGISTEIRGFEIGAWDDRHLSEDKLKPVWIFMEKKYLPQPISSLPVYLVPNDEPDGSSWGVSQIAGMEYIINAMNQSMTYEDLTLVLQGLGVYATTAAPPTNKATNKPGSYKLHPGNVIQMNQGDTFERVSGVTSVAPFTEHIGSLERYLKQGAGVPDMAAGVVDVNVASSGIALALQMAPILSENEDKQLAIGGKWNHIGYDLISQWFPAFEGLNSDGSKFTSTFDDPMPVDRIAYVQELSTLYLDDMILLEEVREKLEKIGYDNVSGVVQKLLDQKMNNATAAAGDPSLFSNDAQDNPPNLTNQIAANGQKT